MIIFYVWIVLSLYIAFENKQAARLFIELLERELVINNHWLWTRPKHQEKLQKKTNGLVNNVLICSNKYYNKITILPPFSEDILNV